MLYHICEYVQEKHLAKDEALHNRLMAALARLRSFTNARNDAAHTIIDLTEKKFINKVGLTPADSITALTEVLALVLGNKVRAQLNIYESLNCWIEECLDASVAVAPQA